MRKPRIASTRGECYTKSQIANRSRTSLGTSRSDKLPACRLRPSPQAGSAGSLWLGYFNVFFAATSVTLGNGDLRSFAGSVALAYSAPVPTTIDDHADPISRQVTIDRGSTYIDDSGTVSHFPYGIFGLAPVDIFVSAASPTA